MFGAAKALNPVQLDLIGFHKQRALLTSSQQQFANLVFDWYQRPRKMLIMVSGGPGTGKTYTVTKTLECLDTKQLRMAYTARTAHSIQGRTIHSTVRLNWQDKSLYRQLEKELEDESDVAECIRKSKALLDEFRCDVEPFVIVVDEVGMIIGWFMYWLVRYFMDRTQKPLLFVVMGDRHQLNPVRSSHSLFTVPAFHELYETHQIHLTESKRFVPEYDALINQLRTFVDQNNENGLFAFVCQHFPVVETIDAKHLKKATRAMAFLNATVNKYNDFYIRHKVKGKRIRLNAVKNDQVDRTKYVDVKPDCLIFVNQNGFSEALNGTQLVFKEYNSAEDVIYCTDPKTNDRVKVCRNERGMFPIDLGFAGTVHKFQGETMDDQHIVINLNGSRDLHLVYTALSRVKQLDQILAIAI